MTPRYPLAKLCKAEVGGSLLLLTASGPTVNCVSYSDGRLLHQWPTQQDEDDDESAFGTGNGDRPNKRRKLDSDDRNPVSRQASEASDVSVEIVSERKKGERKKTKIPNTTLPNVSHLLVTTDSKHVIAVTAEDKALRVFELGTNGRLTEISKRLLPKKPGAIRLTKDERTILTADKFGDVYAVPLRQSPDWVPRMKVNDRGGENYKPSATALTVHTKGNLEALRQQLEMKGLHPLKEGPDFEHQLILGHVSLLTDLAIAEGIVDGRKRPFIITADRDEHIRVSRGMPQAHVIENFCLGHQEFVTKLCVLPRIPELLVAGNGEPTLRVYDWQNGDLKQKVNVYHPSSTTHQHDIQKMETDPMQLPHGRSIERLAVSGIWPIEFQAVSEATGGGVAAILVALEGLPLLYTFLIERDSRIHYAGSIELRGNVLDVVTWNDTKRILVSIDSVHQPFSMKMYRDEAETPESPLQAFEMLSIEGEEASGLSVRWREVQLLFEVSSLVGSLPHAPQSSIEDTADAKVSEKLLSSLGEFLYGLENFRKKRNSTAEETEEPEEAESMATPVES